jgi:alpha-soluble NSF attachment protein
MQEIAELYESEQNIEQAVVYYEKSADFYQNEEVTTSANQCKQKVAQFAAQLEQ